MTNLTVTSVAAATVLAGYLQITAGTRASKDAAGVKKEIPAADKSRSIIIPEFKPAVSSKYAFLVVSALMGCAKDQLTEQWKANPAIKEVEAGLYTEDALLAYAARASESKRLSTESITAWFEQSGLREELVVKYSAKQMAQFAAALQHIAAPTIGWSEDVILKRIVTLGMVEADADHEVCAAMIRRLHARLEQIKAQRAALLQEEELPI